MAATASLHHHFFSLHSDPAQFTTPQSSLLLCCPSLTITIRISLLLKPTNEYSSISSSSTPITCSALPSSSPSSGSSQLGAENWMTSCSLEEQRQVIRVERLWQQFFSNPSQWWDKRFDKKKPNYPDFIHKTAEKALWIDSKFNPPLVHARLAAMVDCQERWQSNVSTAEIPGRLVRMEELWQEFFSDPSQWWDNRSFKKSPKYPDFKHKRTHEALWMESKRNPSWVKAKIAAMTHSGGGLTSRVPDPFCNGNNVIKLCEEGQLKEALHMMELMVQQNTRVPFNAYVGLLKGCTRRKALEEGKRVHALLVQRGGLDSDIFLGNTLVDMYAKCGRVLDARKMFNIMTEHNVFSWTAIISAYADHGESEEAINLFQQMQQTGIAPDKVACVVVLKACAKIAALEQGKQLHSYIIKNGFESDVIVGSALVDMYAKCGCIEDARQVFNGMHERNVVSWNAMISGYAQRGLGKEALVVYEQMKQEGVQPDNVTCVVVLKACAGIASLEQGKHLHFHIIKSGFESNLTVGNGLVDMYAKCGSIKGARQVFNSMHERNVVSWNAMIAGYVQEGLGKEALALYEKMKKEGVQPDNVTYVVLLKACASSAALEQGKQLHTHIIKSGFESNVIVGNSLVNMYTTCGSIEHACQVFNNMHERDVVSWNVMTAGYAQRGLGKEALALYEQMKQEGVQPDVVTYVVLLKACASIAALEQGKHLHSLIIKSGFESNVIVANALVGMYAKCGRIEDACQVFNNMTERDVVSWNAMIAGYAQQGLGKEAFTVLEQMQREGTKPDEVTYLSVLSACSHSGLVDEGRHLLDSMCEDHAVTPALDHYACMVDILSRAECLADAEDFINRMPIQPDAAVWRTLLGAARNHGNVEIGRRAFDCIVKLEPENASAYVLLSNMYAAASRRDEIGELDEGGRVCT